MRWAKTTIHLIMFLLGFLRRSESCKSSEARDGEMGPMLAQLSRRAVAVDANSRCLYFVDTSSGKHFPSVAF